ncbi:hypothetical protein J0J34_04735 [Lactococcus garvieae]|uniref:Uncharacterized protein n=3 Tax=Lactococcus garvieae TaxID=1363 RepID=F9VDN6_LACGL|nr:hypothetical protein N568_0108800 [Lactococcus garvieae TRF1]QSQ99407.1 hypothetical protein J0J34_04735 [Lactococcus garvieae]BAK58576.1 hypothetical protein LCGT_1063 [Lactococcus garvieae ATCC 49156]BAK60437.1 hypothetical protein LCGL_0977 [Lactococcus garvieae Lg2]
MIEANHKKVTQRMKHRDMYWSLTMIHIIIMKKKIALGELFNGEWREKYAKYKEYDDIYHSRDIMNRYRKQGRQGHCVDKRHPSQKV